MEAVANFWKPPSAKSAPVRGVAIALLVTAAALLATACSREPEAQAFSSGLPPQARNLSYVAGGQCHIDAASGTPVIEGWRVNTSTPIWISGWAYDDPGRPASEWIVVELAAPGDRARFFAVSSVRKPNAEVTARLGNSPASHNAAFELVARADMLPRGRYSIRVLMKSEKGGLKCETGRVLDLR